MRQLGLPILALSQQAIFGIQSAVDPSSAFAVETFIESLGVQKYPTLDKIISLAASEKLEVRRPALQYFLSNLERCYNDYRPENFAEYAFIPTKCKSHARLNEVTQRVNLGRAKSLTCLYRCLHRPDGRD